MEFMNNYMVPVIVGVCLCVGYIVKRWVSDVENKYIPTVCAVLGVAIAFWLHWGNITPEVLLMGLASGLASTGLHQAFTQLIGTK